MIGGNETVLKSSIPRKLSPGEDGKNYVSMKKKLKRSIRRSMGAPGTNTETKNHSPESMTKIVN
jgi:hypothetical protein